MQWITAMLAFAVTMLVFAMVTSALVECVHRVLAMRTAGLKLMLGNVFDHAIRKHLSGVAALPEAGNAADAKPAELNPVHNAAAARNAFVEHIIQNRAMQAVPAATPTGWVGGITRFITRFIDRFSERFFGVTDVPVEIFTQKLAGPQFAWAGGKPPATVITDIAQKYEAFGREATIYFESRARLLSVVLAIPVAWLFFVHPQKLAVVYTKNPEVARAVADQATKISAEYEALRERVAGDGKAADIKAAVERLQADLQDTAKRSKELAAAGIPLGWPSPGDHVAACGAAPASHPTKAAFVGACELAVQGTTWTVPTLSGAIWLTVGGLLIGLGAPFWARTVSAMTAARTGSWQRFAEIVGMPVGATARAGTDAAVGTTPSPVSNRTFEVAHAAANATKQP